MIDRASITNWSVAHPWGQKSFVEQDLVISRALVSIYSDPLLSEALAFRGGTALHKLYLAPQVRYSEDIDLVQVEPGPIKPIVEKLDVVLAWLPGKTFDLRRFGFRMRFRYDSELPPSVPMRLKVEVNTYEHFTELGFVKKPFTVENAWFSGSCEIKTYALEELLGTKLRALYQRKKGRDLFDMDYAMKQVEVNIDAVLRCWRRYMTYGGKTAPTAKEFLANMEEKLALPEYCDDVRLMLRPGTEFSVDATYSFVRDSFIDRLATAVVTKKV